MKKSILASALFVVVSISNLSAMNGVPAHGTTPTEKGAPAVRNILSDKLPAKLLTTIKKNYGNYWITSLYKQTANGKVSYHITVENPDQVVKLSTTTSSTWTVERVVSKEEQPAS